jgi:hypothetical protein
LNKKEEAIAQLRAVLRPGSTVYTEIVPSETVTWPRETHIKLHVVQDNVPRSITGLAGSAIGSRMSESGDAIVTLKSLRKAEFSVVAALAIALFHNGFVCIGQGCPSNEHPRGDRNYAPHPHQDGRNALRVLGLKYRNER